MTESVYATTFFPEISIHPSTVHTWRTEVAQVKCKQIREKGVRITKKKKKKRREIDERVKGIYVRTKKAKLGKE